MKSENTAAVGQLSEDEVRALEVCWYEGKMLPLVAPLIEFAGRHRKEILELAGNKTDQASVVTATKRYILGCGSLDMATELLDQIREIQKELWYCGERGDHDSKRIKTDWAAKHAPGWRRWRINEYLFVAERCGTEIAKAVAG